jgi:hypothetical protein
MFPHLPNIPKDQEKQKVVVDNVVIEVEEELQAQPNARSTLSKLAAPNAAN